MNIDLFLEQLKSHGIDNLLKHFGVNRIDAITLNPYSWNP